MKNYEKSFSANVRRLRYAAKMTQKELAEATGYSEKAVSKWERASSVPNIAALYRISGRLNVSIDELFRDDSEICFLGIDGGGTKTELALASPDGSILRTLRVGCCNPIDIGIDASEALLKGAIYEIAGELPTSSIVMFAGIAGGTASDMKRRLGDFFGGFGFKAFANDSDNLNIIAAGLGKSDGVTLILGTGICAFSQLRGVRRRFSGWGYLIDGGGSAYNIGRDALEAYYGALDSSAPKTALSDEFGRLCGDAQVFLGKVYSGGKKLIASFAPMVFTAADNGDEVARSIIERNMAYAAKIIKTASSDFQKVPDFQGGPITVVTAGGLTSQPTMMDYLWKALGDLDRDAAERYQIRPLDCLPVYGAVALAREFYGGAAQSLSSMKGE